MDLIVALQSAASPTLDRFMMFVTNFGAEQVYVALLVIAFVGLSAKNGRRLAIYFLAGVYLMELLKLLFDAPRPFDLDPSIVRGLDYYRHTAFEFVTDRLGAQGTVLGGGRYDGLMESLGGPHTPAVGWAAGIERLAMLAPAFGQRIEQRIHLRQGMRGRQRHAQPLGAGRHGGMADRGNPEAPLHQRRAGGKAGRCTRYAHRLDGRDRWQQGQATRGGAIWISLSMLAAAAFTVGSVLLFRSNAWLLSPFFPAVATSLAVAGGMLAAKRYSSVNTFKSRATQGVTA